VTLHLFKTFALASAIAATVPTAAAAAGGGQVGMPFATTPSVSLPAAGAVAALYDQYKMKPIWFRNGGPTTAVIQVAQILRRAPLDGLAEGPALAAQIEAAVARAASRNPADIALAEQTISSAWVHYVQTIKRPTPGMIYAYDFLKPQGTRTDQILLGAAAAPSLEQYVSSTAVVNPIYARIRDAEWARMQMTASTVPDPRVLANLERARSIPAKGRFVLVDSATQRLFMYENGVPVDSMKVIVGTDDLPTPLIASVMYYVAFNPYWNTPDHLVRKAVAPKTIAGGLKYFKSMGYNVMADWTENSAIIPPDTINWKDVAAGNSHIRVRQDPGPKNFMGILKFPFANPQDIYLHDTPAKELFKKSSRTLSNGCVRLEDAPRFARWLLGRDPTPPSNEPEIQVPVAQPVPIILTYLTVQPTDQGLTFTNDVYGWDKPGAAAQVAAAYVSPVVRN
jgi:L,D-transpeptidase YcbB